MYTPIVSIVIPIYNQEKYVERCLSSLINQAYSNLEIIAVNDGSTDKSLKLIQTVAFSDKRIVVVNKTNGGVVDAICSGIERATGSYICFVDPDDYVGTDYIKRFIDAIGDNDFVAMGFFFDRGKEVVTQQLNANYVFDRNSLDEYCNYLPLSKNGSSSSKDFFAAKWNKMYTASLIKLIAKQYISYKGLTLGEDVLFTYLVLKNSTKVTTFKEPNSYFYNVSNPNSMMSSCEKIIANIELCKKAFSCFDELCDKYANNMNQSYFLYYLLFRTILNNAKKGGKTVLLPALEYYKHDEIYKKSVALMKKRLSFKERLSCVLFGILSPKAYCRIMLRRKRSS